MAIRLDPETIRQKAKDIRGFEQNHDDAIKSIKNLVQNQLPEIFEGKTATAYQNKLNELEPSFVQFKELLEDLATKLEGAANSFEQYDSELSSTM